MVDEAKQRIEVVDEAAIEFEQSVWAMVAAQREAMEEVHRRLGMLESMVRDCRDEGVGYRECARIMDASLERAVLAMQDDFVCTAVDEVVRLAGNLGFLRWYIARDVNGKGNGNG